MSNQDQGNGSYTVQFGDQSLAAGPAGGEPEARADLIVETTTAGFAADVIQPSRSQPVLVDFWAPWCGPCKQLTPVLEKVVREARGRVKLVKMNIDEHPAIAGQLGIQSIPAVIAFRDGQPVDGFMGALPESQVREFIGKLGGKDEGQEVIADALAAAEDLRQGGNLHEATRIYAGILQQEPENLDAIAGLAGTLLDAGDIEHAREVLERAPDGKQDSPQLAGARSRIELAEQVASLGDAAELTKRLDADPRDHQARYDLALIENAKGNRQEAADHLLAIMKADREWQDDGARRQLLQFFEAWGMTDEATLTARRKLSSLLFS